MSNWRLTYSFVDELTVFELTIQCITTGEEREDVPFSGYASEGDRLVKRVRWTW